MSAPWPRPATALLLAAGALLALGSAGGCVKMTVGMTAPVVRIAASAFHEESDLELARAASPGQLKTAEGFLAASPENPDLLEVVAQGYAEYAFGFLEDELEATPDDAKRREERALMTARVTALYDRALAYAVRLVALSDRRFPEALKKDAAAVEEAAAKVGRRAAPGLFWAGLSMASAINLNRTDLGRVIDLPKAIVLLKRAHALDPSLASGGPAMALGTIYASQGKAMGGDPEAARRFYEEAIRASTGRYLMPKVLLARFYAVVVQDRPLFEKTLAEVLAADVLAAPEHRLPNELARRRARRYLAKAEDLF